MGGHTVDVKPEVDALALERRRDVDAIEVPDRVGQPVRGHHALGAIHQPDRGSAVDRGQQAHRGIPAARHRTAGARLKQARGDVRGPRIARPDDLDRRIDSGRQRRHLFDE